MSTNVLPAYSASHIMLEGVKSEMKSKPSQFGDSPLLWQSPWILPAFVVSNEQDDEKRPTVKIAKCTIDTGSLQGNIVSRKLVETLGFSPSDFEKLTEDEERGGSGITGDPHIPQGAIYLTWYHNNSTRVFRDMRFLVSPSESCDMIVGAWSIQKDKILDVPCLPLGRPSQSNMVAFTPDKDDDARLKALGRIDHAVRTNWQDWTTQAQRKKNTDQYATLDKLAQKSAVEVDVTYWLIRVYKIWQEEQNNPQSTNEAVEIWKELDLNWYMMRNGEPPEDIQNQLEKVYQHLTEELKLKDEREKAKETSQEMNKI